MLCYGSQWWKNGDPQKHRASTQLIPTTSPDPPSTHTPLSLSWSASHPGTTEPTSKQYQTYLKHWETICQSNGLGKLEATVANGIDFWATLFSAGLGCSAINIACLPLSSVMVLPNNIIFQMKI